MEYKGVFFPKKILEILEAMTEAGLIANPCEYIRNCVYNQLKCNPDLIPILQKHAPSLIWFEDQLGKFDFTPSQSKLPHYKKCQGEIKQ